MENNNSVILSICIATYNRCGFLRDIIKKLLECQNYKFNICVTDNCSTDDTESFFSELNNPKVYYFRNSKNIGGSNNIIQAIFNSNSKYAYYLNDRDIIDINKLEKLIEFLETNPPLTFVDIDGYYNFSGKTNSEKYVIYEKGYESLLNQHVSTHPSELLFNTEILKRYYSAADFFVYSDLVYAYDFMAREMMCRGRSAHYELGLWKERADFKKVNHSGYMKKGQPPFFDPLFYLGIVKESLSHTLRLCNELQISNKLKIDLFRKIFSDYEWIEIYRYKKYMMSKSECNHYGIEKKYIGFIKLLSILYKYEQWFNEWIYGTFHYKFHFLKRLFYKINKSLCVISFSVKEDIKLLINYK